MKIRDVEKWDDYQKKEKIKRKKPRKKDLDFINKSRILIKNNKK